MKEHKIKLKPSDFCKAKTTLFRRFIDGINAGKAIEHKIKSNKINIIELSNEIKGFSKEFIQGILSVIKKDENTKIEFVHSDKKLQKRAEEAMKI